jgi:hypothetical protein
VVFIPFFQIPLHGACLDGHVEVVQELLKREDLQLNLQDIVSKGTFSSVIIKGRILTLHFLHQDEVSKLKAKEQQRISLVRIV